jgi:hypothetical protein
LARLLVLALATHAGAQSLEASLTPDETYEDIGWSVALSGDTLAVGSPGLGSGAVDVFVRNGGTWTLQAELAAPEGSSYGTLGSAVDLDGDVLLAGDPTTSDGSWSQPGHEHGSAHVFRRVGGLWSHEALLEPATLQDLDLFGKAVAIDGDVAAVGAPRADPLGEASGSVWVFRRSGGFWVEEAVVAAPDGGAGQRFGEALALDGVTLVIGAPAADGVGPDCGAAYVYLHDGVAWTLQQKVTAPDGVRDDRFGAALSLDGERLAAGVPRRDPAGQGNAGAVALFVRASGLWQQEAWLAAAAPRPVDNLGTSVALQGDILVAGAPDDDTAAPMGGAAHVWRRIGGAWVIQPALLTPFAVEGDVCGVAVALDGDRAAVGCLWRNGPALGSNGAADVWSGMLQGGGP